MKHLLSLVLVSCVLIASISSCKNHKTASSSLQTALDSLYTQEFPNSDEPGGSVLVKKGDQTLFLHNYGVADIESGEKITENTLFNTGSISKTFVSNGILILQQEGKLAIDDSIAKYFTDFTNQEIANKVTIKHWLSHTSGIPDVRKISENLEFFLTAKDTQNFAPLKKVDSLLFEPGERFNYSNPSYNGLALIIDQVTGAPWQDFIYKKILAPSGMSTTVIQDGAYPSSGIAHGYVLEDGMYQELDYGEEPTFAASGNSGVWSSVVELAAYEKALQNHLFLTKELTDQSRTVWSPTNWSSEKPPHIGYSWFIEKDTLFGEPNPYDVSFVYHTGSNAGFNSFYMSIPEKEILMIALFNQPLQQFRKMVFDTLSILHRENWGA